MLSNTYVKHHVYLSDGIHDVVIITKYSQKSSAESQQRNQPNLFSKTRHHTEHKSDDKGWTDDLLSSFGVR